MLQVSYQAHFFHLAFSARNYSFVSTFVSSLVLSKQQRPPMSKQQTRPTRSGSKLKMDNLHTLTFSIPSVFHPPPRNFNNNNKVSPVDFATCARTGYNNKTAQSMKAFPKWFACYSSRAVGTTQRMPKTIASRTFGAFMGGSSMIPYLPPPPPWVPYRKPLTPRFPCSRFPSVKDLESICYYEQEMQE